MLSREHRAYKRYIVSGVAQLETGGSKVPCQLVTLGGGGMLVRGETTPPIGTLLKVDFAVSGYGMVPPSILATSSVVWTQPGKVGLQFVQEPAGLPTLLAWLEREHSPWAGTEDGPQRPS